MLNFSLSYRRYFPHLNLLYTHKHPISISKCHHISHKSLAKPIRINPHIIISLVQTTLRKTLKLNDCLIPICNSSTSVVRVVSCKYPANRVSLIDLNGYRQEKVGSEVIWRSTMWKTKSVSCICGLINIILIERECMYELV